MLSKTTWTTKSSFTTPETFWNRKVLTSIVPGYPSRNIVLILMMIQRPANEYFSSYNSPSRTATSLY